MLHYEEIANHQEKISIIGLGYVGLPIAVSFSKKVEVIGFDINKEKIEEYINGIDRTREVGNDAIKNCSVEFTSVESRLKEAKFHIVAVPTPVNADHTPNLVPIESASRILGRNLEEGSVIVYESTVYPGVTEDICIPILEVESGLKCGIDFKVGYSPERINPGDKLHRIDNIVKVVSGMDEETLDTVAKVYELIANAGVYRAESIKVAEAAKVIENSQRDINIAFINELSIIFNKMGIDTRAVLKAAGTKWNFLNFYPGLVGGHCIGVDPYYLTYKAEQLGYHSQVILSGRRINDDIGKYITDNLIKNLLRADIPVKDAKIAILGFTFKENCPDTRNTRVIDIVQELQEYDIKPIIHDPVADIKETEFEYGIKLSPIEEVRNIDAIVIAVAHTQFLSIQKADLDRLYKDVPNKNRVMLDIKGIFDRKVFESEQYIYWRL